MGQASSKPVTTKVTAACENSQFKVGSSCMQGWRMTMEDSHTHILNLPDDPDASFFAVYDGHGGSVVAQHAKDKMHTFIVERPEYQNGDIGSAVEQGFLQFDRWMLRDEQTEADMTGSTAVTVLIKNDKLYCGNLGDSRAVACINGFLYPLSSDHKPSKPSEEIRIKAAGGWVENNRVNGVLAPSRAIGDFVLKGNSSKSAEEQIVIALPDVERRTVTEEWEFLILASDGIWDVSTNGEAVYFIRYRLGTGMEPEKICEELMNTCLSTDCQTDALGCDNMTVILVCFLHGKTWEEYCAKLMETIKIKRENFPGDSEQNRSDHKPDDKGNALAVEHANANENTENVSNVGIEVNFQDDIKQEPVEPDAQGNQNSEESNSHPHIPLVQQSLPKRVLTEACSAPITESNSDLQEATLRCSSSTVDYSRENIELEDRQSFISSIIDSVIASYSGGNISDGIKNVSQTPAQRTPAKRTGRGKAKNPRMKENEEKSTKEEGPSVSEDKSAKRPRESEKESIREQKIAVALQEKSTRRPRRGKAQVEIVGPKVESNSEVENEPATIKKTLFSAPQETPAKRTRRGKEQEKIENLVEEKNTELKEVSKNEPDQKRVSVPPKMPAKRTRRGQAKDITVEETEEDSTRTQVIASAPQEKSTTRPRRGKALGKIVGPKVVSNSEVENEPTTIKKTIFSAPQESPAKRTRSGKEQEKIENLVEEKNTELKEVSKNEPDQKRVSVPPKMPAKRTRRGQAKDITVEETEEDSTRTQVIASAPQEKSTTRPRRGKALGKIVGPKVVSNSEVENEPTTIKKTIFSAPQETPAKRTRRGKEQEKIENLVEEKNTELKEVSKNEPDQKRVSVPPKMPAKRTRRGQAKDIAVEETEEDSTRTQVIASVPQEKSTTRPRRGKALGKIVGPKVESNSEVENEPTTIKKTIFSAPQESPAKRTRRGKEQEKIENLVEEKNTELKEVSKNEPDQKRVSVPPKMPAKRTRRGQAKDITVEETEEDSTRTQVIASAPQEKSTTRPRRGKALGKIVGPKVVSNSEVENEPTTIKKTIFSAPQESPAKRTRSGKEQEKIENLVEEKNTELKEVSKNEPDQKRVSVPPKMPAKRTRRGQAKDITVEETEEDSTRTQVIASAPQEKSTTRPRRGKALGKIVGPKVESNSKVENEPTTIKKTIFSAPQETPAKRTRRGKGQEKIENLVEEKNTELKEVSKNEHDQESVSVPPKKPAKRTRRGFQNSCIQKHKH